MSEFMKSFGANAEQAAAHKEWTRKFMAQMQAMETRLVAKVKGMEMKNQEEAAAWAKAAAEVSEQLNRDIEGMIEEQQRQDRAA